MVEVVKIYISDHRNASKCNMLVPVLGRGLKKQKGLTLSQR